MFTVLLNMHVTKIMLHLSLVDVLPKECAFQSATHKGRDLL